MKKVYRWRSVLAACLTALLLAVAVAPKTTQGAGNEKLHPMLAKRAASGSSNFVDVIVAVSPTASIRDIERATGGKVVKRWSFINAAQIRLPENKLRDLATSTGVKFVSPDSPVKGTAALYESNQVVTRYQESLKVQKFWDHGYFGQNIGVAVLDSGVAPVSSLAGRLVNVVLPTIGDSQDYYGHGTHVAGIIAGDAGDRLHVGMAPRATIFNVRITDTEGNARESDILSGLEWVYNNYRSKNIRVVNLSFQASVANDYATSPLSAAVEKLWMSGVVVVVSSGNRGGSDASAEYPPANDPYVITVGAMDDRGTSGTGDDLVIGWSTQGRTQEGRLKPDILAPGRGLLSTVSPNSRLARDYAQLVQGEYIQLSGSSMAAPTISGAVALMLTYAPSLKPDQVKYLLLTKRRDVDGQINGGPGAPKLDNIYDELDHPNTVGYANQGLKPSVFLTEDPAVVAEAVSLMNIYYETYYYLNNIPDKAYYGY